MVMVFTKWIGPEELTWSLVSFTFGDICLKSLLGLSIFYMGGWLINDGDGFDLFSLSRFTSNALIDSVQQVTNLVIHIGLLLSESSLERGKL